MGGTRAAEHINSNSTCKHTWSNPTSTEAIYCDAPVHFTHTNISSWPCLVFFVPATNFKVSSHAQPGSKSSTYSTLPRPLPRNQQCFAM